MTDAGAPPTGTNGTEPPARRPRIVIDFDSVNGSECRITPEGDVTTGQLYLAAWLLDAFAHETRLGERAMAAAARPPILVPADHRRAGGARRC